jgi:hypothetical protein
VTSSATIWGAALQSAATLLASGPSAPRWGLDQPREEVGWAGSAVPMASAAGRVVELAVRIVLELPDDHEAGISEVKEAARRWLDSHGS